MSNVFCKCGCGKEVKTKGRQFCSGHKQQFIARNSPWYSRIEKGKPNECWLFLKRNGSYWTNYAQCLHNGKIQKVSRLVLEQKLKRPIKKGYKACHTCDNPPCCNPTHLFEGTDADNMADRNAKGRARGGSNIEGKNPSTKITYAMVCWARKKYRNTELSYAKVAILFTKKFGINIGASRIHALNTRPWGREKRKQKRDDEIRKAKGGY